MEYHEKKRLIKIIRNVIFIIIFGLIYHFYATSPSKAYKELDKYLKNKYGEEFVIGYMGRRKVNRREWYEAGVVYPKSYIGTVKENDTYYWGRGFAEIKGIGLDVGDNYGGVLLNESANEFYGKKLKELFGENVLPVLNIRGEYKYTDFLKEYLRVEKTISGGIYIFGRVENDEDREWYRKQIYEFVQFMKQTGTFEYVDLGIIIWDERVLSEEFRTNDDLRREILVARNTIKDDKEFVKERKRLMKQTDESMKKLTKEEKEQVLNNYIKSDIYGESNNVDRIFTYNELLGTKIYSPKYIESQGLRHREKTNYEKVENVKFWSELY